MPTIRTLLLAGTMLSGLALHTPAALAQQDGVLRLAQADADKQRQQQRPGAPPAARPAPTPQAQPPRSAPPPPPQAQPRQAPPPMQQQQRPSAAPPAPQRPVAAPPSPPQQPQRPAVQERSAPPSRPADRAPPPVQTQRPSPGGVPPASSTQGRPGQPPPPPSALERRPGQPPAPSAAQPGGPPAGATPPAVQGRPAQPPVPPSALERRPGQPPAPGSAGQPPGAQRPGQPPVTTQQRPTGPGQPAQPGQTGQVPSSAQPAPQPGQPGAPRFGQPGQPGQPGAQPGQVPPPAAQGGGRPGVGTAVGVGVGAAVGVGIGAAIGRNTPPPPDKPVDAARFIAPSSGAPQPRIDDLRGQRREERVGDRVIIREPDRTIIREGGRTIIRHNEIERFAVRARDVRTERRGDETISIVERPGGVRIVSVIGADGRLLRRIRRDSFGREVVIVNNAYVTPGYEQTYFIDLPPPVIHIPRERYIVEAAVAPPAAIYGVLTAEPVEPVSMRYSLDQVRYSYPVRQRMPSVDLDVNFEFGSWQLTPDQIDKLATIADGIKRAIDANPQEVFLIEGHTDAVGNDVDNLSLSDRRAESVAVALQEQFQVPAENLVTQGYGEQYLKVNTQAAERLNRRVTVRRITPLIDQQAQGADPNVPPPPQAR